MSVAALVVERSIDGRDVALCAQGDDGRTTWLTG
jgi:hypothetical protein